MLLLRILSIAKGNNEELIDSERIFDKFAKRYRLTKNEVMSILPTRNDFAYVYRFLKQNKGFIYGEYALVNALNYKISMGKTYCYSLFNEGTWLNKLATRTLPKYH